MKIKIGTRGSQLALTQVELVSTALHQAHTDIEIEVVPLKTLGDRKQGTESAKVSDKKDWVYDLECAILDGRIDLAVHSGKDVPANIEPGTVLHPILKRATPFDAFIGKINPETAQRFKFEELAQGATVGTASLRRGAQALLARADLRIISHRGNVPTRITKLDQNPKIDGIILACAGLERLSLKGELQGVSYQQLSPDLFLPALAQGTLVAQFAQTRTDIAEILDSLTDQDTYNSWQAERTLALELEGDCKSAIGIFSTCSGDRLALRSRVMSPDGKECLELSDEGISSEAIAIGKQLGKRLLRAGARAVIERAKEF